MSCPLYSSCIYLFVIVHGTEGHPYCLLDFYHSHHNNGLSSRFYFLPT